MQHVAQLKTRKVNIMKQFYITLLSYFTVFLLLTGHVCAERVIISNAPETITSSGILYELNNFSGKARLIIHHKNMQFTDITEEGNQVSVLITPLSKSANVKLVAGISVSRSGYVAGVASTNAYLEQTQAMPKSHLETGNIVDHNLSITQQIKIVLGSVSRYNVFSMTGDIDADAPIKIEIVFGKTNATEAHGYSYHMAGTYIYSIVPTNITTDTIVMLGVSPYLTDKTTRKTNKGNYGVTTEIKLPLSFKERKLTISARGGRAYVVLHVRACLGIPEGEWIIVDLQAYESATYILSKDEMTIKTYPIPGSSYPVRLHFKGN